MFSFFKDKEFWKVFAFFAPFYYFNSGLFLWSRMILASVPFLRVYSEYTFDYLITPRWHPSPLGGEYLHGGAILLFLIFFISYKARKIYLLDIKPSAFQSFKKIFVPTLIATLIILAFFVVFSYLNCPSYARSFCATDGWFIPGALVPTIDLAKALLPLIIVYPLLATLVIKTKKTGKVYRILFWLITAILYAWIPFIYYAMSRMYN